MGRVRTKTVKKSARFLIEKYYMLLTTDFQINKTFCDEVALIPSKGLRNKIAGFVTHLMKRLDKGNVKGLNIEIKEKELDHKTDFEDMFDVSNSKNKINIDKDTEQMLNALLIDYKTLTENQY
jgi:small subunit ribosomal protein S17e